MAGSSTSYYFVIIGTKDNPLYEAEFGSFKQGGDGIAKFREEQRHMNQFIAHSSLDCIEDQQWASKEMYLKTVDKFNNTWVSCFLTGGNIKFLLVHDTRSDEPIRQFFTDVYDLYCKTLMNPFYEVNMAIRSQTFDQKIKAAAKKYL
ncbi:TRAPP subunit [Orbilia oligospora]|nr:TRAPP subunit [Orbilia oligospora]KAF3099097.1 TRAPP subunit [Orbilia oligospora]KAF3101947.1 TRAPP subunit [Orbilia oligospora]KAF3121271.1 TRAPP subunit [Orbilia oligospora]KAF3146699.1 TRAPP subunit [Orbilia oligospora]